MPLSPLCVPFHAFIPWLRPCYALIFPAPRFGFLIHSQVRFAYVAAAFDLLITERPPGYIYILHGLTVGSWHRRPAPFKDLNIPTITPRTLRDFPQSVFAWDVGKVKLSVVCHGDMESLSTRIKDEGIPIRHLWRYISILQALEMGWRGWTPGSEGCRHRTCQIILCENMRHLSILSRTSKKQGFCVSDF